MKLTEFLNDIGRPVAYHPGIKRITGSTTATILLCQLIYWTGKQADPDGWIYKTSEELEEETGLTYDEQVTARKRLIKRGFIEESYKRLDHQMKFRIMEEAIEQEWGKTKPLIPESRITALGKADSSNSLNRDTETTTENTTENTIPSDVRFPENLNTPEFKGEWNEWITYRKEIKHPIKITTQDRQIKSLEKYSPDVACAMLEQSITNGWQGIFPIKDNNGNGHKSEEWPVIR